MSLFRQLFSDSTGNRGTFALISLMVICFINSSALAVDHDNAPHIFGDALQSLSKQKGSITEHREKPEEDIVLAQSRSEQRIIIQVRRAIQRALNAKGFPVGRPDGRFGPQTRKAIAGFQNSIGATPTGKLTRDEVQNLLAPESLSASTPTPDGSGTSPVDSMAMAGRSDAGKSLEGVRSIWDHNGSSVGLIANGQARRFVYVRPRPGMRKACASEGDTVFAGRKQGNRYVGTAYMFSCQCGTASYSVRGPISRAGKRVVLSGQAPRRDKNCRVTGRRRDKSVFDFRENYQNTPAYTLTRPGVNIESDRIMPDGAITGGTVAASASQSADVTASQANMVLAKDLGIPVLHGRLAIMDDTSAINAGLRFKHVRFAWQHFLESATFAESPGLVEEHDVAKILAKRHLSNSDKTAIAAAVGHGKLGETHRESFGFFFSDALDEFQKKKFIELMKTVYLPRLAKSAPTWPVRIVNIKRVGVSKYNFETRKITFGIGKDRFRLDLPGASTDAPSEYFKTPAAPLPLKAWPTSISLPEAQAKEFLSQLDKVYNDTRVAYIAIFGTMKKTDKGFETQVEKLSLFADPMLKKEMVQFNLNPLRKGAAVSRAEPRYDLLRETSEGVREHAPITSGHMMLYLLRYFSDRLTEEEKRLLYFDVGKRAAEIELKAKKTALGAIRDRNRRRRRKEAVAIVSFEQMVRAGDTDAQRAFAQTVLMRKWDLTFVSKYIPANLKNMARVHLVLSLFELGDFQGRNPEFVVSEKLDVVKKLVALLVEELPSKTFVTSWTGNAKVDALTRRLVFTNRNLLEHWDYRAFASSAKESTSTVLPDEAAPYPIYKGFYNWVGRMPSYLAAKFSKKAYRMPARTILFKNPRLRKYPEALAGGHILGAFYQADGTERIRSSILFTPNRPLDLSQVEIGLRRLELIANSISSYGSDLNFLLAFNIDKLARHEEKDGIAMMTTLGSLYLLDKKGKVVLVTEFPDPAAGVEKKIASVKKAKADAGVGNVKAEQPIGPKGKVDLDVLGIKLGLPLGKAKSILETTFKGSIVKVAAKKSGGFTMADVEAFRCEQAQRAARNEASARASFLGRELTPDEESELDKKQAACSSGKAEEQKWDGQTLFKLAHSIEVNYGQGIIDHIDLFVPGNPAEKQNIIAIGRAISEKGRGQFTQAVVKKYGEAFIKMPTAMFWFSDPRFRRRESIIECELRDWPYRSGKKLDHKIFKKDCGQFVALRTGKRTQMLLVDSGFKHATHVQAKKPAKPAPVIKF